MELAMLLLACGNFGQLAPVAAPFAPLPRAPAPCLF
jgi:hypothetical protein